LERKFDKSVLRRLSKERAIPLPQLILDTCSRAGIRATLLGISPMTGYVVEAALLASKSLGSPIMFIASLNQVDVDGGYTGWSHRSFAEFVAKLVERLGVDTPVMLALDHAGPWLKDRHVEEGLGLEEAMERVKRSIEEAIRAGFEVIHIDTTVEPGEVPSPEVVARRSAELIEFAEEVRKSIGGVPICYEVGSDRWGRRDEDSVLEMLAHLRRYLGSRGVEAKLLFLVGDVGTRVALNNKLDASRASSLVNLARSHGMYLKVHSTDFVENPSDFPKTGVGGANVGPEFAYRQYIAVKSIAEKVGSEEALKTLDTIRRAVLEDGRWRRYTSGEPIENLELREQDFVLGICSRYIWSTPAVKQQLTQLAQEAKSRGIDLEKKIVEELRKSIEHYLQSFNLKNLTKTIENLTQSTAH